MKYLMKSKSFTESIETKFQISATQNKTYIRIYEDIKRDPKVGDYIYCNWNFSVKEWEDYINGNIGQIIEIKLNSYSGKYRVKYYVDDQIYDKIFKGDDEEDVIKTTEDGNKYIIMKLVRDEIIGFSSDKEYLKTMMMVNKYNL